MIFPNEFKREIRCAQVSCRQTYTATDTYTSIFLGVSTFNRRPSQKNTTTEIQFEKIEREQSDKKAKTLKALNISQHVRFLLKISLPDFKYIHSLTRSHTISKQNSEWKKNRSSFGDKKINVQNHSIYAIQTMVPLLSQHSTHNKYYIISIIIICALKIEATTRGGGEEGSELRRILNTERSVR